MTWLYIPSQFVQESEESRSACDSLPEMPSDLSATLKGKSITPQSWRNAWRRGILSLLRFGTISEPSTDDHGVATWISSLEDCPASRTQLQEKDRGTRTIDTSGQPSSGSSKKLNLPWSSWKTCQLSLLPGGSRQSESGYAKWASGLKNRCSSLRKTLAHLIVENESLSSLIGPDLESGDAWPTPAARDYKGANSAKHCLETGRGRKHMDQLANFAVHYQIQAPWIPCQNCPEFWCTIHAMHAHDCECPSIEEWGDRDPYSPQAPTETGQESPNGSTRRRLNPVFVSWLMGIPFGWSCAGIEPINFDLWATQWSQVLWQLRSLFLPRGLELWKAEIQ